MTDRFNIPEENEVGHIHIVNLLAGQVLGMLGSASEGYKVAIQNMIDTSKFVKKNQCFGTRIMRGSLICSWQQKNETTNSPIH